MKTKTCFKCHNTKPLNEFYKHPQMADGHLGKCIECTRKDVATHRLSNIDKIRAYDRKRSKTFKRRNHITNNTKKYRKKNKLAYLAHCILNNAIRDKKIIKQPCQICGSTHRIHGHHDDYYKPLEVIWLCAVHHAERHKTLRGLQ